ncbi:hypothetical protein [Streptomyces sp. NPDC056982]|uniref:hypothetical protein n=1 Tax=Streptomyces sp. NPDC056982 TaxID=3345986 RepID=UPI00362B186E
MPYAVPQPLTPSAAEPGTVYTVASGDLRAAADITGWPSRQKLEADLTAALTDLGRTVRRAHAVDEKKGHGFIDSQRAGIEVFKQLPPDAPLIVVEGVWQYSHHVLAGLRSHRGPILDVANWSGEFPGLVGLLNLTGSLTKAGRPACGPRAGERGRAARGGDPATSGRHHPGVADDARGPARRDA